MSNFAFGLMGVKALFAASRSVERDEFRAFVDCENVTSQFPGAMGMGFAESVDRSELGTFLESTRIDGAPGFAVTTSGDAPDLMIVKFIEPLAHNRGALGFDIGQEQARRAAAESAVMTGRVELTGPIRLVQAPTEVGLLILLTVFRNGMPIETSELRRAALQGWVYMTVLPSTVMDGVIASTDGQLDFELFDGSRPDRALQLYQSDRRVNKPYGPSDAASIGERTLSRCEPLEVIGRTWTIFTGTTPQFDAASRRSGTTGIGLCGLTLTILTAGFARNAAHRRESLRLQQDVSRFRELAEAAPAMVWAAEREPVGTYFNRMWLKFTGRALESELGHGWIAGVHHQDIAAFMEQLAGAFGSRVPVEAEFRLRRYDGVYRWVLARCTPRFRNDSEYLGYVGVAVDIHERRVAADMIRAAYDELTDANVKLEASRREAESAHRVKSEFLANMSHEIRTPMTAILGYTDLLLDDGDAPRTPETCADALQAIRRSGAHLLTVIDDILDLSKIEARQLSCERIPTSPGRIVEEVRSLMQLRASEKNLSLSVAFEGLVPETIASDPIRLRQILLNLLGNAIKFTEKGGVSLTVGLDGLDTARPRLRYSVRDTGIGISIENFGKLFDAFAQADGSVARRFGGTGLGLHISRRLAHMLGGDITVHSEVGVGSTFTLEIDTGPLDGVSMVEPGAIVEERAPRKTLPSNEPTAPTDDLPLALRRILFAEDGPDNQKLIAFHLRRAGAEVTIVDDGRKAIEALTIDGTFSGTLRDPAPFDLILMDMQMPDVDGYSATRTLRSRGFRRPIIAMTAHAMSDDRDKCIRAGCDEYLTKPINRDRLIQTIHQRISDRNPISPSVS